MTPGPGEAVRTRVAIAKKRSVVVCGIRPNQPICHVCCSVSRALANLRLRDVVEDCRLADGGHAHLEPGHHARGAPARRAQSLDAARGAALPDYAGRPS